MPQNVLIRLNELITLLSVAVYLITFHSYCSWLPDHPRGYVRRKKGILPADPKMSTNYRHRAKHERVRFTSEDCDFLLDLAINECSQSSRQWQLHMGVAVFNHVHLLVSWAAITPIDRVQAVLHRALNVGMRDRHHAANGRPFLSRGGSVKRVADHAHYNHLVHTYLPSHRKYGGVLRTSQLWL